MTDQPYTGTMISDLIDQLTYISYRYNRERSPEVTPERWEKVFGVQAREMELRFQYEVNKKHRPGSDYQHKEHLYGSENAQG